MSYYVDLENLRKFVYSRFKSKQRFGEKMGWNPPKVTRIMKGYQYPKLDEIWRMAQVCRMSEYEVMETFFARD